ncbi:MAG TPA: hypothetical protein EYP85_05030 [Armatimonadetes bacterium]|nr:hypothetical protein [Armatimonadota bacterium]
MRRLRFSPWLILVGMLGWAEGNAAPTAWDLLAWAQAPSVRYVGTMVTVTQFRQERIVSRVRVYYQGPQRERMEYLSGELAGAVWGRNERHFWRYDPVLKRVIVSPWPSEEKRPQRWALLRANYSVSLLPPPVEPIAGRPVLALTLKPHHSANPWKRLWLDREKHVILKQELRDAQGTLLTQMQFQEINFDPPLEENLFALPHTKQITTVRVQPPRRLSPSQLGRLVGFKVVEPPYLPPGYVLEGYYAYHCPCGCQMISAQLQYTDGLNTLSIFETDRKHAGCFLPQGCPTVEGSEKTPCLLADYGCAKTASVLTTQPLIVVVGNLAEEELTRIARELGQRAKPVQTHRAGQ